jgi:ParB family chromosome partitioning protein
MSIQSIPLSQLEVSPQNARKSFSKSGIEEMKASILAHGLLQNLTVTKADTGKHYVVAGARRLRAFQALEKDGAIPSDHPVSCQLADEDKAAELSLAENTVREAMHPADEFDAFSALAEDLKPEEIAVRFGVTTKHVQQRMRLARLAPELMKAYRAGDMDLDALMAFTLSDDHNQQRKVYKATGKKPGVHQVRRMMTEKTESSKDKLCRFVTLKAYVDAGGKIREDLFGTETFLENPDLLHELAADKLKALEEKLKAEGWGWVHAALESEYGFTHKYGRIQAKATQPPKDLIQKHAKLAKECDKLENQLQDMDGSDPRYQELDDKSDEMVVQLEALETEIEAYNKFDPEQMKTAGVYARIDHDGSLLIDRGLVSKAAEKKLEQTKTGAKAGPKEKGFSQALIDSLKQYRLQIAQAALASDADVAFDLLVFKAACDKFTNSYIHTGPEVSFSRSHFRSDMVQDAKNTPAGKAILQVQEKLKLAWLKEKTETAKFEAFRDLTQSQKLELLAFCTAGTLQSQLAQKNAFEAALGATDVDVAEYWRPTADNYLGRITRDQLLDVGREIFSKEWAGKWASAKKPDLVKELDRAFADPKKFSGNKETEEKLRTWLPEGMAFTLPEKKAAKAKKKAA